jgi:hypothetical protein
MAFGKTPYIKYYIAIFKSLYFNLFITRYVIRFDKYIFNFFIL